MTSRVLIVRRLPYLHDINKLVIGICVLCVGVTKYDSYMYTRQLYVVIAHNKH